MRIVTFYADCELPAAPKAKQEGFDWRWAIGELERSAEKFGLPVAIVTDHSTRFFDPWLRVGSARATGLMLWLLEAQAAALEASSEPIVMISPDTLLAGPIDWLLGDWDVCLLTRQRPSPIINSVIAAKPCAAALWREFCRAADDLPPASKAWGADVDAIVRTLKIKKSENAIRIFDGIRVRFMPLAGRFESISPGHPMRRPEAPIWDFKGSRKAYMAQYATLL